MLGIIMLSGYLKICLKWRRNNLRRILFWDPPLEMGAIEVGAHLSAGTEVSLPIPVIEESAVEVPLPFVHYHTQRAEDSLLGSSPEIGTIGRGSCRSYLLPRLVPAAFPPLKYGRGNTPNDGSCCGITRTAALCAGISRPADKNLGTLRETGGVDDKKLARHMREKKKMGIMEAELRGASLK